VEITVSGGISPYYFLWSNQQTSQNIDSIEAGFYITSVTDSNGCTRTASASVNQPDSLSLTITTDDIECYGSDWGSADAFMMGGVMPYQFIWSNGDTTNVLTGLNAGYYYLTATDLNNCIITGTAIIGSPDSLIITAYVANPSCYGYNNGLIDLSGSGGTTPYFYTWSDSTTTEDACFLSSGSYSVTISDQNGCLITAGYNLIQPPLLTGDISPKNPLCSGLESGLAEVSVMGGTTPYCFIWSDGQETAVASSLHAGIYTLTVTDIMGCIFLDTINITQPDEVTIVQEITPATCILFSDGSISISVSGGTSPYSISWQDNQPDISIAGLSAGEYYVTVTDANSCVLTAVFEVTNLYPECFRIPNVFTPNGDSVNDTWVIDGMDLFPSAIVKVFDRWNRIVFQSSGNYIPWDGKYRGTDCPVDAYYFIIDFHANIQPVTGKLSIIR
jgi:gliding motility-associated-like protein